MKNEKEGTQMGQGQKDQARRRAFVDRDEDILWTILTDHRKVEAPKELARFSKFFI